MRDRRFISEHRGGLLKKELHHQLMKWACACVLHVLNLQEEKTDDRLQNAIQIAHDWTNGQAAVTDARKASLVAIEVANESSNPMHVAIARSIGHAVATAHMSDHSLIAAIYALQAIKIAGKSVEIERDWQNEQLLTEIRELIMSSRNTKEKGLNLA